VNVVVINTGAVCKAW